MYKMFLLWESFPREVIFMTLEEIMTENPIWVNPTTTASAAARQMLRSNLGGLPVCSESGKLCGESSLVSLHTAGLWCIVASYCQEKGSCC